jgi:hypothetical protein
VITATTIAGGITTETATATIASDPAGLFTPMVASACASGAAP